MIYGQAPRPGAPGTWDRDVWWALSQAGRTGRGPGPGGGRRAALPWRAERHGITVVGGRPRLPFGHSTAHNAARSHLPVVVLFAWRCGELVGHMTVWRCGSRTAYFRLTSEPAFAPCTLCRAAVLREAQR